MALQPLAQQLAATLGGGTPPALVLQCRLDARAGNMQINSQPATAVQQQGHCSSAAGAWLTADVSLATAAAARRTAAPGMLAHVKNM